MSQGNPYLDPGRVQAALNRLGLRPNRDLGQNFLTDGAALDAMLETADLGPNDTVIEVGPGLGVLTWELVRRAGRVIAIELDRRLAERLSEELRAPNLEVVQSDVLRVDPGALIGDAPGYKVAANLPYQITSAILRHFLEASAPPERMIVMVQKEVAERIAAQPPEMSVLAHSVQIYAEPRIVVRVPAAMFIPAPKVDSAVLGLVRRPRPAVEVNDINAFFRLVKAGFLHARKKLANGLGGGLAAMGTPVDREMLLATMEQAGIDPGRRAETLTLDEWATLYRRLEPALSAAGRS
jgi:16S rRNA (adenine1518-N6/adenine1519-N6)-dimethyltransferase